MQFLSTPSARRATHTIALDDRTDDISIHALREEGDGNRFQNCPAFMISIHALREEGDRKQRGDDHAHDHISIHALREEGDWQFTWIDKRNL